MFKKNILSDKQELLIRGGLIDLLKKRGEGVSLSLIPASYSKGLGVYIHLPFQSETWFHSFKHPIC